MARLGNLAVVVTVLLAVPSEAAAHRGFRSGEGLRRDCAQATSGAIPPACLAFVEGVSDTLSILEPLKYCPPAEVSLGAVAGAVRDYLALHPETSGYSGASTAAAALMTSFPCVHGGASLKRGASAQVRSSATG